MNRTFARMTLILMLNLALPVLSALPAGGPADEPELPQEDAALLAAMAGGADDPELVRELLLSLGQEDPDARARGVQLLWDAAGSKALPTVLRMAADPDDNVALAAVRLLIDQGDPRAEQAIRTGLGSGARAAPYKAQLVSSLADRGDTRFVPEIGALLSHESAALRRTALLGLRALNAPEAFRWFMATTADADPQVSTTAVDALAKLRNPAALPRVGLLLKTGDPRLLASAAAAVPALGGTGPYADQLVLLVRGGSAPVIRAILGAIRQYPSGEDLPVLTAAAASDDEAVRVLACRTLVTSPDDGSEDLLVRLLGDDSERVRAAAVQALGDREASAQLERVLKLADDRSVRVRTAVATALGRFDAADSYVALGTMSRDEEAGVRLVAVSSAGNLGGARAFPILQAGSADADAYVRVEAIRGLARMNTEKALAIIRQKVNDPDLAVRVSAINELGRLGDKASLEVLKKARLDEAEAIRNAARTALEGIRD